MHINKPDSIISIALLAGITSVLVVYWPGLYGVFLFDDFPNLSSLGENGGVNDFESFKKYILSGFAGPTGRPISLLTFLIDANNWPAPSFPFKYTNLLIHALNGILLFWVMLSLFRFIQKTEEPDSSAKAAALVAALAWALHPYLVSTTLYVVQRMAQLSLLFSLIGMLVWLRGRRQVTKRPVAAYLCMVCGVSIGGGLATLSKENGLLLPLLLWAIEITVVQASGKPPLNIWWRRVFFVLPAVFIVGYLIARGFNNGWLDLYPGRDFSPYERILTESRVLFVYLYNWFVPHLYTSGIFHDSFEISKGAFTPLTTVFSLFGTVLLVFGAIYHRKEYPLFGLAILVFYICQLVESTTVGLEIMFEHRMYAASIFLLLPPLYSAWQRFQPVQSSCLSVCVLVLLAFFCWQRATVWSDYKTMYQMWAIKAPLSPRAQVALSRQYLDQGGVKESMAILDDAARDIPNSFYVRMTQAMVQCQLGTLESDTKDRLSSLAAIVQYKTSWYDLMYKTLDTIRVDRCEGITPSDMLAIFDTFLSRPPTSNSSTLGFSQLTYLKGVAHLMTGANDSAVVDFSESVDSHSNPQKLMSIATQLAMHGNYTKAEFYAASTLRELESGKIPLRERSRSPSISDVKSFLNVVKKEKNDEEKNKYRNSSQK